MSYLSKRTQITRINQTVSTCHWMWSSIGVNLGPTTFSYIQKWSSPCNSWLKHHNLCWWLYPHTIVSDKDKDKTIEKANSCLKKINKWFIQNKLLLNTSKTKGFFFHKTINVSSSTLADITINNQPIEIVSRIKLLCVESDSKLRWRNHISKMSFTTAILYKARHILKYKWKLHLYNTHFLPFINYCILVWGNAAKQHLSRIDLI